MVDYYERMGMYDDHDYHSPISLTLNELESSGYLDLEEVEWDYYDDEQRSRIVSMIRGRYGDASISALPVTRWVRMFTNRLNELMYTYKPLYERIDEDDFDWFRDVDEYTKGRSIYSDFPQTLLNGENQDYATNGNDNEAERIITGSNMNKYLDFTNKVRSIDVIIVDGVDSFFSSLITVNVNGF